MAPNNPAQPTLYDSWRALVHFVHYFRRRLRIAFLVPFLLCFVISFVPTPRYKSQSILVVRMGVEYIYQPETARTLNAPAQLIPFDREQIFKSEVAILSSDSLHEDVIRTVGMERLFPQLFNLSWFHIGMIRLHHAIRDALTFLGIAQEQTLTEDQILMARAIELFDKSFDIELEKESAIITLTYKHPDANLANETLATLLKLFFAQRHVLYQESRVAEAETHRDEKYKEMQQAAQAVSEYKILHHLYDLDTQREQLLEQRTALLTQSTHITHPGIHDAIARYDAMLDGLSNDEHGLKELQNKADIATNAYALASQNLDEEKSLEQRLQQHGNSVRVIQPPQTPPYPRRWQKIIILLGAVLGIFSVLATAAFSEFSRYAPRNRRASDQPNPHDTGNRRRQSDTR